MERSDNILKNIEIQQKFADTIFKDFRSKRFGINTCCSLDLKNKHSIQKALCDWDSKKKTTYTKKYTETNWVNCSKPIPEWVQYGDPSPSPINCPPCESFGHPTPQPCYATVWFYKDFITQWPNESGEAKLIALAGRANQDWLVVGECTYPTFTTTTNDDGSTTTSTTDTTDGTFCDYVENPDDPKNPILKFKVYADDSSVIGKTGAYKSDEIRWVIVDPVDSGKKVYDFEVWGGDWQQYAGTDHNIYPNPQNCNGGQFALYKSTVKNTITLVCEEDPCKRCVFCGEGWPTLNNPIDGTEPRYDITGEPECKCDSECLYITVTDACGKVVPNWEIVLDGGLIGKTNDEGVLVHTIDKASVNTKHSLDICGFCFTTTGNCNQKKIDIVIDDGKDCTCDNPEQHCYIRKEDDCSYTPIPPAPPNPQTV